MSYQPCWHRYKAIFHQYKKFVTIQPQMHTDKLKYKELTRLIIKNFYQVYKELGGGFPGISLVFPFPRAAWEPGKKQSV